VPDKRPTLSDIDTAPEALPVVQAQEGALVPATDLQERFLELANYNFELKAENTALTQQLRSKEKIHNLMTPYANKVFWFLCAYGLACLTLLLLDGFHTWGFDSPDSVMQVVVGSTAVSAIGLVGLVIKGMFEALKAGN
jgi:hypothetical protein